MKPLWHKLIVLSLVPVLAGDAFPLPSTSPSASMPPYNVVSSFEEQALAQALRSFPKQIDAIRRRDAAEAFRQENAQRLDYSPAGGSLRYLLPVQWRHGVLSVYGPGGWLLRVRHRDAVALEELGLHDRFRVGPLVLSTYRCPVLPRPPLSGRPRYIMGIAGSWHDVAAVLVRDGKVVAGLEEERMTRRKHETTQFPIHAVRRLLRDHHLRWEDIDHIALGWNYNYYVATPHSMAPVDELFARADEAYAYTQGIPLTDIRRRDVPERNKARFQTVKVEDFLSRIGQLEGSTYRPPVTFVPHHWAHAASAYYPSGFKEPTLVFTFDGYGDGESTTIWMGREQDLDRIASVELPHSIGWAYTAMTEYLGFKTNSGEGEVMGLAPYGAPRPGDAVEQARVDALRHFMREFIVLSDHGRFETKPSYMCYGARPKGYERVTQALVDRLGPIVPPFPASRSTKDLVDPSAPENRPYANLAFVLQERFQEAVMHVVRHYTHSDPRTRDAKAVVFAGGVTLNVTANGRMVAEGIIRPESSFFQPAAGDAGTALGAALVVSRDVYGQEVHFAMQRADFGTVYTEEQIEATLRAFGLEEGRDFIRLPDDRTVAERAASRLAQGQSLAWFQSGSEFGPRALGNRSILLNLSDPGSHPMANQVKDRQPWRPSAISSTWEWARKSIEHLGKGESPFMLISYPIKPELESVVHSGYHPVDKTTRPQTVRQENNPLFWSLLQALGERTGIPAVINTSFNRQEPLVETPEEALNTFAYMSGLEALFLGRYMVTSRLGIRPSVIALSDEPLTRDLLKTAIASGSITDWDRLMEALRHIGQETGPQLCEIVVTMRNSSGKERTLRWPLMKEIFDGKYQPGLLRYLGAALYNAALDEGASQIFIGSTSDKYDLVVCDILSKTLKKYPRLERFANQGDPITFARFSELEHLAPQSESSAKYTWNPDGQKGWAIGVDVGATKTKAVLLHDGNVVYVSRTQTPHSSGHALADHLESIIRDVYGHIPSVEGGRRPLDAIGIDVPGVVTMPPGRNGQIRWLVNLETHWIMQAGETLQDHYDALNRLPDNLSQRYGAPVRVLNDGKAFGVAEVARFPQEPSRGHRVSILSFGTGVGMVTQDGSVIDFSRADQMPAGVVNVKASQPLDPALGTSGSMAASLGREAWESAALSNDVTNLKEALSIGAGSDYENILDVVRDKAGMLAQWIVHFEYSRGTRDVLLTGGAVPGRLGEFLIQETLRALKDQYGITDMTLRLSPLDPSLGGAMGAAFYALQARTPKPASKPQTLLEGKDFKIERIINPQGIDIHRLHDLRSGSSCDVLIGRGMTVSSLKVKIGGRLREVLYYPGYPDDVTTKSGGVPHGFPWLGRIAKGRFMWNDFEHDLNDVRNPPGTVLLKKDEHGNPNHGMVRYLPFELVPERMGRDALGVFITGRLDARHYPDIERHFGPIVLQVTLRLKGNELVFDDDIENPGKQSTPIFPGRHPWFRINPRAKESVLIQVPAKRYWKSNTQLFPEYQLPLPVSGKLDLRRPTPLGDNTYVDIFALDPNGRPTAAVLEQEDMRIEVVADPHYKALVLYTSEDGTAVAIEPQIAPPDAINLHQVTGLEEAKPHVLEAGGTFHSQMSINVLARSSFWSWFTGFKAGLGALLSSLGRTRPASSKDTTAA